MDKFVWIIVFSLVSVVKGQELSFLDSNESKRTEQHMVSGLLQYDGQFDSNGKIFHIARNQESDIAVIADEEHFTNKGGKLYLVRVVCIKPGFIGMPNPAGMLGDYTSKIDNSKCYVFPLKPADEEMDSTANIRSSLNGEEINQPVAIRNGSEVHTGQNLLQYQYQFLAGIIDRYVDLALGILQSV